MESTETPAPLAFGSGGAVASVAVAVAAAGIPGPLPPSMVTEAGAAAAESASAVVKETRFYTRNEVSEHCFEGDVWIIIRDRVYDVSSFVDRHPGGSEIMFDYAGMDATDAFESLGHSEDARKLVLKFDIGGVKEVD